MLVPLDPPDSDAIAVCAIDTNTESTDKVRPVNRTPTENDLLPRKRPPPTSNKEWMSTPNRVKKKPRVEEREDNNMNSPFLRQLKKLDEKSADQLETETKQHLALLNLCLNSTLKKFRKSFEEKVSKLKVHHAEQMKKKENEWNEKLKQHLETATQLSQEKSSKEKLEKSLSEARQLEKANAEEKCRLEKALAELEKASAEEKLKLEKASAEEKLKFEKLKQSNEFLQSQLQKREVDLKESEKRHATLEGEHKTLKADYKVLKDEFQALTRDVDSLVGSIQARKKVLG